MDAAVAAALPQAKRPPECTITIPGPPRGKGSGRPAILQPNPAKGRFEARAMIFPDKQTASYEAIVKFAACEQWGDRPPLDCELRLRVTAVFAVPASWSKKRQGEALGGIIRPSVKPDDDNLIKIRDAFKGVIFRDDALFVETVVRKFYGTTPLLRFEIWKHSSLLL